MINHTVTLSPLKLGPGHRVGLTDEQYKDRAHNLAKTDVVGVYETLREVEFKVGEDVALMASSLPRQAKDQAHDDKPARPPKKAKLRPSASDDL